MFATRSFTRLFHIQCTSLAAEKSLLATLRKKTGYTFTNCKKALELHNNDLTEAEVWLKQQAQTLGWAKATKLEGRQTSQGLVGLTIEGNYGALIEVNCETDFVARNTEFHKMVQEATKSCLSFAKQKNTNKINLSSDDLKNLLGNDGKKLSDHLALMIGTVGENASLKRGFCMKCPDGIHLSGYVHPSGSNEPILLGKIGALVALKQLKENDVDLDKLGKELCQHIVGMNPKKVGSTDDEPCKNKEEETHLIHQEYLLDDSVTVDEFLKENEIEVVDFKRFECGEISEVSNQNLEDLETCQ